MKVRFKVLFSALLACLMVLTYAPLSKKTVADDTYGQDAYNYMKYIGEHFPERIATNEMNKATREWLISEIQSIGYTVTLEDFSGTSPLGWGDFFGTNLIFTKAGESRKEFVIGAHYDSAWAPGADDNGSGVGVLLETAKRVKDANLPYSVRFILFDAEEPGCLGSQSHINNATPQYLENIICMINLDCLAIGDHMMAYGGDYNQETGEFSRLWTYDSVMKLASRLKIDLTTHPEVNANYPVPTKAVGSDNGPFNAAGVPYIYFEASNWMGGEYTNQYQVDLKIVEDGKIMHCAEYDNMAFLEAHFAARMKNYLHDYARLVHEILKGKLTIPEEITGRPEETIPEPTEPETIVEETTEPETVAPETLAPETLAPETEPETAAPTEEEQTTEAQTEEAEISTEAEPDDTEEVTEATEEVVEPTQAATPAPSKDNTAPTKAGSADDMKSNTGLKVGLWIAVVIVIMVVFFILVLTMSFINERRAEQRRSKRK